MTINEILRKGIEILQKASIDEAITKARIVLVFSIDKNKEYLISNDKENISQKQEEKYLEYIQRLKNGEPLQHITGKQEFMKLDFVVNKDVLIPRPDTELLVEEAIEISKEIERPYILDLCTGSGAIAVSLAKYIEKAIIIATDISEPAIKTAKENANNNKVSNKIKFIQSNLFENVESKEQFDIIVSNPPYIKSEELKTLSSEVKSEPRLALDGDIDGLKFYRQIIIDAVKYLKKDGYLCLEIGYDQKEEVIDLINRNDNCDNIYSKKDLSGNDRIVVCQLKNN